VNKSQIEGKIQTVLGPISPEDLKITLTHEHFLIDMTLWFQEPTSSSDKFFAHQPVSLENLGWIRYHMFDNLDDLMLLDEQMAVVEALRYKYAGGKSVVDLTSCGAGRDPLALARISRATGLHIIMGAGYYVDQAKGLSEEEIFQHIIQDITEGADNTGICSGIIGEVGINSWPLREWDKMSLYASAKAQRQTGAAINIHPARSPESPFEIIDLLSNAGVDIHRVVMSHIDRTIFEYENLFKLAGAGCYLEYDLFGTEGWYPRRSVLSETSLIKADLPNDAGRINAIMNLINNGFLNQILISQDVCKKHQTRRYGGLGYDHILQNIVPAMREKGMSEKQIYTILVDNPKRLLTFH
jgi:phosphotriesterase-related protein